MGGGNSRHQAANQKDFHPQDKYMKMLAVNQLAGYQGEHIVV
jgi:hypothetical protein